MSDEHNYPILGKTEQLDFKKFSCLWTSHPNEDVDVAVMPLDPHLKKNLNRRSKKPRPYIIAADDKIILDLEYAEAVEKIFFVGYPGGKSDINNFIPFARSGITSTPYALNFNGLPAFTIDASIYPGSSGSPVFISRGRQPHLLGGVLSNCVIYGDNKECLHIGLVFRAHVILETIARHLNNNKL